MEIALDATSNRRSLLRDALRRFLNNRAACVSVVIFVGVVAACVFGPSFTGHPFDEVYWDYVEKPPDIQAGFLFGTDSNGRDLLTRLLHGGRVSISIGIVATAMSALIGVAVGVVAGYVGGIIDLMIMRLIEVFNSVPFLFFVILLTVVFGSSILMIFVAISAVEWLDMARIARAQTIGLKRQEFIDAARLMRVPALTILLRHIVPNSSGVIIVYMTLTVPRVILLESYLSFLGLGVQEPSTSWGVMISDGVSVMATAPWVLLFPAGALTIVVFVFNFIGDGLRDALDPRGGNAH